MSLKPNVKSKVDELFLLWLTDLDTQQMLKENLCQLIRGEPLSQVTSIGGYGAARSARTQHSPRFRPSSPTLPTSKLSSPRSPRRPLSNKNNHRAVNGKQPIKEKEIVKEREKESTLPERDKDTNKENKQHHVQVAAPSIQHVHISKETIKDGNKAKRNNSHSAVLSKPQVPNHVHIPTFYFPMGRPVPAEETDSVLQRVAQAFSKYDGGKVYHKDMNIITKVCDMPLYWKYPLFFAAGGEKQEFITFQMFATMWKKLMQTNHDTAARFISLLARSGANCLTSDELIPLIQDVVETHPGLSFLQEAPEFHSRYVHTVIARIFYCVNRSWTGKITVPELRKSNFLQTLALLEDEEDINQITDFFSYEHFYVIYCKFWELDKDHDLYIDKEDLTRHNDHGKDLIQHYQAISSRMIDRIFSGAVTRGQTQKEGKLSYPDFVFFLISEEDKRHPTSVEYWFRCMDLDGDGVISMYEMEYFYEEQMQKMESLGIEKLPFHDCLCQMFDLVRPNVEGKITLKDLKACKLTNIFFDTFFNLDKFLDHEQRDPFANARDLEISGPELSDWEKYASEEYEILVSEEGINEQEEIHYEDDFEVDDDDLLQDEMIIHPDPPSSPKKSIPRTTTSNDIYDFGNSTSLGY